MTGLPVMRLSFDKGLVSNGVGLNVAGRKKGLLDIAAGDGVVTAGVNRDSSAEDSAGSIGVGEKLGESCLASITIPSWTEEALPISVFFWEKNNAQKPAEPAIRIPTKTRASLFLHQLREGLSGIRTAS